MTKLADDPQGKPQPRRENFVQRLVNNITTGTTAAERASFDKPYFVPATVKAAVTASKDGGTQNWRQARTAMHYDKNTGTYDFNKRPWEGKQKPSFAYGAAHQPLLNPDAAAKVTGWMDSLNSHAPDLRNKKTYDAPAVPNGFKFRDAKPHGGVDHYSQTVADALINHGIQGGPYDKKGNRHLDFYNRQQQDYAKSPEQAAYVSNLRELGSSWFSNARLPRNNDKPMRVTISDSWVTTPKDKGLTEAEWNENYRSFYKPSNPLLFGSKNYGKAVLHRYADETVEDGHTLASLFGEEVIGHGAEGPSYSGWHGPSEGKGLRYSERRGAVADYLDSNSSAAFKQGPYAAGRYGEYSAPVFTDAVAQGILNKPYRSPLQEEGVKGLKDARALLYPLGLYIRGMTGKATPNADPLRPPWFFHPAYVTRPHDAAEWLKSSEIESVPWGAKTPLRSTVEDSVERYQDKLRENGLVLAAQ